MKQTTISGYIKWFIFTIAMLGIVTYAAVGKGLANAYKTHKVNETTFIASCNDEREPVVRKFENKTFVMVSCEVLK